MCINLVSGFSEASCNLIHGDSEVISSILCTPAVLATTVGGMEQW